MSLHNYKQGDLGKKWADIVCDDISCNTLNVAVGLDNIYTTDGVVTGDRVVDAAANKLEITSNYAGRENHILTDDNIITCGIGNAMYSVNSGGTIQSSVFSGDATLCGGFSDQVTIGVQELPLGGDQAVVLCDYDGANYNAQMVAVEGGNVCSLGFSNGVSSLDASTSCSINSPSVSLVAQATGSSQGLSISAAGEIGVMPYIETQEYVPVYSNFVGCSGVTHTYAKGTRIGNDVTFSIACSVATTVGSGGSVSFRVTVPTGWEPDNDWTISNVGETFGSMIKVNFFTATGSNVGQFFGSTTSKQYGVTFFSNAITSHLIKATGTYRIDN